MPTAAIVLADTSKLCRVVVPKSLLLQTAQVLQSRIGGLVGRRMRNVPYSRRSLCDAAILSLYHRMHTEMLEKGGVMLCLPEHILSFTLSGLQLLVDRRPKLGRRMVQIQTYLQDNCRDVLDESDMTLSVYTQPIYPSGKLTTLNGHSHRWLVVAQLLGPVESHIEQLQKRFEGQVVVVQRSSRYPIFHFITKHPEEPPCRHYVAAPGLCIRRQQSFCSVACGATGGAADTAANVRPRGSATHMSGPVDLTSPRLLEYVCNVAWMARHGQLASTSALRQIEQGREVVLQIEHMRVKETRVRQVALAFPGLDVVIARFVETGELNTQEPILQAFDYIGKSQNRSTLWYSSHRFPLLRVARVLPNCSSRCHL